MLANDILFQMHALDVLIVRSYSSINVARVNLQANANTQVNACEVHAHEYFCTYVYTVMECTCMVRA
jgi:hypothetical protein